MEKTQELQALVSDLSNFEKPVEPATAPEVATNESNGNLDTNNALSTFHSISLASNNPTEDRDNDTTSDQEVASTAESEKNTVSDERCKYGSCLGEGGNDLLSAVAELNEYVYKYNDTAKGIPGAEEHGVDDEVHVGPIAQELAENPATSGAVDEDPLSGFLTVDTKALSLAEMSILSSMAKRLLALEEKVYGR